MAKRQPGHGGRSAHLSGHNVLITGAFGLFIRDQVLRLGVIPMIGDLLMRQFVSDGLALPD